MSTQEQDAALLRLVRQRSDVKKRKALLENELRSAGRALRYAGTTLESVGLSGTHTETPGYALSEVRKAPEICGLSKLDAMLSELASLNRELDTLNHTVRECGLD